MFVVVFLITKNNKTSFSYHSYLMFENITNKYDGEYECKANELNSPKSVHTLNRVVVNSQYFTTYIYII